MQETNRHHEAFLYYYELGSKRTLVQVGQKVGVTKQSVERWSIAHKWQERVQAKDAEINERADAAQTKSLSERKVEYSEIAQNGIELWRKKLKGEKQICPHCNESMDIPGNDLVIQRVEDLVRLVKLDLMLSGEEQINSIKGLNQDILNLKQEYDAMSDEEFKKSAQDFADEATQFANNLHSNGILIPPKKDDSGN